MLSEACFRKQVFCKLWVSYNSNILCEVNQPADSNLPFILSVQTEGGVRYKQYPNSEAASFRPIAMQRRN